ncbi:MAG: hypothetical protein O3A00_19140 [Planctomycetota bacterium]|nr:hypothetical protein [Planctomycetota bacterium]
MKAEATGIVLGGALQLDEQLTLPDHSRVRVAVETIEDAKTRYREGLKAWKELCEAHPIHAGGRRFTRDELHGRR